MQNTFDSLHLKIVLQTSSDVEKLLSTTRKRNVGTIINNILERRYPGNVEGIAFEELISWDMWQTFIKIQSKRYKFCQCYFYYFNYSSGNQAMIKHLSEFNLSEKCITLCISAKSILENVCTQIMSGDITLRDLSLIKECYIHLRKLLSETMCEGELKNLEQLLNQRFFERDQFILRLNDLKQLFQYINIDVDGKWLVLAIAIPITSNVHRVGSITA